MSLSEEPKAKCPKCNAELNNDSLFCHHCGTKIEKVESHTQYSPYAYIPPSATAQRTYMHTPTYTPTYTQTRVQKKEMPPKVKALIIIGVIIFAIILIASIANSSDEGEELTPVAEPRSGAILSGYAYSDGSEITVTAPRNESCVVVLKAEAEMGTLDRYKAEQNGESVPLISILSFYVRAGETVTVGVPCDYLYVYFAYGDTWYG